MTPLEELVQAIQAEAATARHGGDNFPYLQHFHQAVEKSVREVAEGASSEDFVALVMINFILKAVEGGADAAGLRGFLRGHGVLPTQEVEAAWEEEGERE